jgi:CRP-like cAMP-binding protein
MEEVISFLNEIAKAEGRQLSPRCIKYLKTIIKKKNLKQDEHLLVAGEVCENLYFIKKGLLKCYYILRGKQVCDWFFGEMETVVAVDSFYDQILSLDFIQALEDCELLYITYDELNYLYRNFVEFNAVGRVLTHKYFRIWHRQARNIRMLSKEERYRLLMATQPDLINRVPVRDLASFLDMNKDTLSRMRSRIH